MLFHMRSINRTSRLLLLLLLLLPGFYSCKKDDLSSEATVPVNGQDLLTVMQTNFQYGLFYYGIKKTGLDSLLQGKGPYTIFIADDASMKLAGLGSQHALDSIDPVQLKRLLEYHILPGKIMFKDVPQTVNNEYKSISGQTLYLSEYVDPLGSNSRLTVNGHYCKQFDVMAANGVIQVLESLPLNLPDQTIGAYLEANPAYSYFTAALKKFGLFDQLNSSEGPITLFVPNNDAFTMNGLDIDAVNAMDTLHFDKYLFSCYLINPDRMFISDFNILSYVGTGLYTPGKGILTVGQNTYVNSPDPLNSNALGGYANFVHSDLLMSNGVVHEINNLVIYPQNEAK